MRTIRCWRLLRQSRQRCPNLPRKRTRRTVSPLVRSRGSMLHSIPPCSPPANPRHCRINCAMLTHFAMTDTAAGIVCHPRANVLGVGVHAVNMAAAVKTIAEAVTARSKGYVCPTGVHGVMEARRDPSLRKIFSRALLVVPDGMPTVWMGHLQGLPHMQRVFGPDLMLEVIGNQALRSCSHFLYGGDFGVAPQLEASLRRRFPHIRIAGTYTPPFRPLNEEERAELSELVDRLQP